MASISTSTSTLPEEGSPRTLAELLQERQEPFVSEVYLLKRGCTRKNLYSEGTCGCISWGKRTRKRSMDVAKKCSEIAKALCNMLLSINEIIRLKGCDIGDAEFAGTNHGMRKEKEVVTMEESERLSSGTGSFSTEFNSCSEGDVKDTLGNGSQTHRQPKHQTNESATDIMVEWRIAEENKQCSPNSVLDEIEASPVYNARSNKQEEVQSTLSFNLPKKPTEESIFSASMCDLLIRNSREKKGGFGPSNYTCSWHISSKTALMQTRQLLFDCVREAVESQGRKQRKTEHLMGPEKLGRIICDNMRVWERQSAKGKKIAWLLRSDLLGSFEEWESFEGFRGKIVKEVADHILEEIKDEMMEEVLDLFICKTQKFVGTGS